MPYINSKVTVSLSEDKTNKLKEELGRIICDIPGKSENFLMVGFEDNYTLYFKCEKLKLGAFIEVKIFGKTSKDSLNTMTKHLCELFTRELGIPGETIYIKYEEVDNWGWNGSNF